MTWLTAAVLDRDFRLDEVDWRAWFQARGEDDLSLLLFVIWDPIGVNDTAIAAGEYANYAANVLTYVQNEDPVGLTSYLLDVERRAMGLFKAQSATLARCRRARRATTSSLSRQRNDQPPEGQGLQAGLEGR